MHGGGYPDSPRGRRQQTAWLLPPWGAGAAARRAGANSWHQQVGRAHYSGFGRRVAPPSSPASLPRFTGDGGAELEQHRTL